VAQPVDHDGHGGPPVAALHQGQVGPEPGQVAGLGADEDVGWHVCRQPRHQLLLPEDGERRRRLLRAEEAALS
jgi:hypothetical protein